MQKMCVLLGGKNSASINTHLRCTAFEPHGRFTADWTHIPPAVGMTPHVIGPDFQILSGRHITRDCDAGEPCTRTPRQELSNLIHSLIFSDVVGVPTIGSNISNRLISMVLVADPKWLLPWHKHNSKWSCKQPGRQHFDFKPSPNCWKPVILHFNTLQLCSICIVCNLKRKPSVIVSVSKCS